MNRIIERLDLKPHPEGGFYKEMHRSKKHIKDVSSGEDKNAYTSIYYLLSGRDFSAWHRVQSDETWFYHLGCDMQIYYFDESQALQQCQLGLESMNLQITIPANTWFSAKPLDEDAFCLVGCAVAPGFEFSAFELAQREDFLAMFGTTQENVEVIRAFTRV